MTSLSNTTTYLFVLTNKTNVNMKVYYSRMALSWANKQNCHCRLKLRFERRQRKTTTILGPSVTRTRFELTTFQIQVSDWVRNLGLQRVNINNDDDIDSSLVQYNGYLLTYRINNTSACYKATGIWRDDDDDDDDYNVTPSYELVREVEVLTPPVFYLGPLRKWMVSFTPRLPYHRTCNSWYCLCAKTVRRSEDPNVLPSAIIIFNVDRTGWVRPTAVLILLSQFTASRWCEFLTRTSAFRPLF
jgi:hypothetical protein